MAIASSRLVVIVCALLWLSGLSRTALAQQQATQQLDTETPDSLRAAERLIYKSVGDVSLPLYVFKPEGWQASDRRAAIVFYFGGGWRGGSPTQFATHAQYLASRGLVAICVEYRVHSRHQATVAECVHDAKSALRWVRSHADELGIDPERIASSGGSAGGHLAAAVALLPGHDDPQDDTSISCIPNAMALFNPAVDLSAEGLGRTADPQKTRELESRLGADLDSLSPATHVKAGLPPCIIFHGKDDTTVPYAQVEAFTAAMTAAGNRCELAGYDGQGHGFFNENRGNKRAYYDTLRELDEFLASLGYLEGQPTIEAETP